MSTVVHAQLVRDAGWGRGVPRVGAAGWVLEGAIPGTQLLDGKTLGILAITSRNVHGGLRSTSGMLPPTPWHPPTSRVN